MGSERTSKIFISYRREDSEGWAGRLAEKLEQAFGAATVFYDYDAIDPSSSWKSAIEAALNRCKLLFAIIGPRWLNATTAGGHRRLDDPDDLVRFELATALERQIPILPVMVGKATLPRPADLPKELEGILNHQAVELPSQSWKREVEFLLTVAEKIIGPRKKQPSSPGRRIIVGERLALENSEAGSIIGVRGSKIREGIEQVVVGKNAAIRGTKMQDIVGIELTENKNK